MSWFDPAVSNSNWRTILLTNHASDRQNFPMFEECMPSLSKFLLRQHTRQFLSFSRPRLVSSEPYTSFSNLVAQKKNAIFIYAKGIYFAFLSNWPAPKRFPSFFYAIFSSFLSPFSFSLTPLFSNFLPSNINIET